MESEKCKLKKNRWVCKAFSKSTEGVTLFLFVFSMVLFQSPSEAVTVSEVSRELSCRCGCTMTVDSCNHTNCPFATPARGLIDEKISAGLSGKEIIQSFVAKHGEQVLAAPTTKGFNLTAWVLPFFMIIVGGGIVRAVIIRLSKRHENQEKIPHEADDQMMGSEDYRKKVERDLRDLDV